MRKFKSREECATFVEKFLSSDTVSNNDNDEIDLSCTALTNVFGVGRTVVSDVPEACLYNDNVCLGIDEAGRGSVLGPMVYGGAYWNETIDAAKIPTDFNDSKQLSDEHRSRLFNNILYKTPEIGFCIRVLQASEISRNMLRKNPYNLNQMSHDAAASIIQSLLDAGVKVQRCYIDTVGNPDYYKNRLQREFPNLSFVVESKADANYPSCSAASVVAKVTRDRLISSWKYSEPALFEGCTKFGSGYPSDPVCKAWMEKNLNCRIFGYADVVRFSWKPTKTLLEKSAGDTKFKADEDEDSDGGTKRQRDCMKSYFSTGASNGNVANKKQCPFYTQRHLKPLYKLP